MAKKAKAILQDLQNASVVVQQLITTFLNLLPKEQKAVAKKEKEECCPQEWSKHFTGHLDEQRHDILCALAQNVALAEHIENAGKDCEPDCPDGDDKSA